jgi:5'(3')-deoxyribonucleotidase
MKALILDVDGVILEWEEPFMKFLESKNIFGNDDVSQYKFHLRYNVPRKVMTNLVNEFNSSDATRTLDPFRDSVEHIQQLRQIGYTLIAVTHMGTCPQAYANRQHNLKEVFGNDTISELYCIDQSVPKSVKLAELSTRFKGALWVEDHPHNARLGKELGYQALLMDHPHNQNETDLVRVYNWKDVMEKIQ